MHNIGVNAPAICPYTATAGALTQYLGTLERFVQKANREGISATDVMEITQHMSICSNQQDTLIAK